MSEVQVFVHAIGTTSAASLPQSGMDPAIARAKYLRIVLSTDQRAGIFERDSVLREGASGTDIYLRPGQLDLKYDERVQAVASPATLWAYRRSQLSTPNGLLVLGTLFTAVTAAWIDGSIAIGNLGTKLFLLSPKMLSELGAVSLMCKLTTAVMAFLLALWFKKS